MKGTDLLEGLNFIDEAFVNEASDECEVTKEKKHPIPFFVMEVAAACLVLFLILSGAITVFLNYHRQKEPAGTLVEVTDETDAPTPNVSPDTTDEPKKTENPIILNTEEPKDGLNMNDTINEGMFSQQEGYFHPQMNRPSETIHPTPTKRPLPNVDDDYLASVDKPTPRPEAPSVPDIVDPTKTPSTNISGGIGNGNGSGNVPNTPKPKPTKSPNGDSWHPQGTFPPNHESNTPWPDDPLVSHTARPEPTEAPPEDVPIPPSEPSDWVEVEDPTELPEVPDSSGEPSLPEPTEGAPMPTPRPKPTPTPSPSPTPTPTPTPGVEEE